ncbi:hypothetical protein D0Z70_24115 [Sphingobium terrigena]|uniref:LysR substrate-binding domain-containing protein n=1 Tax=Sphingobium terrigena TaxID=2304063 RepID=A0A418YI16_9SPHN|nr:hypothetical protein D0Z70_24115 [Sphingobium terrigena]
MRLPLIISVCGAGKGPAGLVRIASPPALDRMNIIPRLPDFIAQFPEISVGFSVAQRLTSLVRKGVDVALRGRKRPLIHAAERRRPVEWWRGSASGGAGSA